MLSGAVLLTNSRVSIKSEYFYAAASVHFRYAGNSIFARCFFLQQSDKSPYISICHCGLNATRSIARNSTIKYVFTFKKGLR